MGLDICAVAAPNLVYPPSTPEELDQTGKMVEAEKRRWIGVKADIREVPALQSAVDRAVKEFGKLDIAVANAAIQIYGPLAEMPDENWNNVIDVNLTGTANTLRAVLPQRCDNPSYRTHAERGHESFSPDRAPNCRDEVLSCLNL